MTTPVPTVDVTYLDTASVVQTVTIPVNVLLMRTTGVVYYPPNTSDVYFVPWGRILQIHSPLGSNNGEPMWI